jgi:hypothetical protein
MPELVPAILFCAVVLLLLFGVPWWSVRRAMRRDGLAPCVNYLESQAGLLRFLAICGSPLVVVGASMAAWRSDTAPLVHFTLYMLACCLAGIFAVLAVLLPPAFELNRALAQMIRLGTPPPARSAAVIRRCLARTRWLQIPLFRLRGVTREQLEQFFAHRG